MLEVAAAVITEVAAVIRGEGANVVYIGREGFTGKMGMGFLMLLEVFFFRFLLLLDYFSCSDGFKVGRVGPVG